MILPVLSALLPLVASANEGSMAKKRKKKSEPDPSTPVGFLYRINMERMIRSLDPITMDELMSPDFFILSEDEMMGINMNLARSGRLSTGLGTFVVDRIKPNPTNELERIEKFKQLQAASMMTPLRSNIAIYHDESEDATMIARDGKLWAGADYIRETESKFPLEIPYESPFRVLNSHQAYVNDLIRNSPEAAVSLIDYKVKLK